MGATNDLGSLEDVDRDIGVLESFRWFRMTLSDRICAGSRKQSDNVLSVLRLEATHQLAEFLYVLKAQRIETVADIERLALLHNDYIAELTKNAEKTVRLGLTKERLLSCMFTVDTMPRLVQHWREKPGSIDQSNLARLLVLVMSTETCRKVLVACADAGFLLRERTPYGTVLISSTGALEAIFSETLRETRKKWTDLEGTIALRPPSVQESGRRRQRKNVDG